MKKITHYIPLQLSFFLVIGIFVGTYYPLNIRLLSILLIGSLTALLITHFIANKHFNLLRLFQFISFLVVFFLGWIRWSSQDPRQDAHYYGAHIHTSNTLIFQVEEIRKPSLYHYKYYAKVLQIDSIPSTGKILVNIPKDSCAKTLILGGVYMTKTALKKVNTPLNPYAFNYNKYLNTKGITHQISLQSGTYKRVGVLASPNLSIRARQWSQKIQNKLKKYDFGKNELGIINALILGQRKNISRELLTQYSQAGAIHILAVSGLHVGILFLLLSFLFKPLEYFSYGNILKTTLIILTLFAFALLTGLSGSVVRAVSMFSFIAIGDSLKKRENSVLYALITSFFFIVVLHPAYIFDVGFQMSYTAVLGILLFQPIFLQFFPTTSFWLPQKIIQLFSVSVAATLGTLPISLYYFHQFPGLFFITNIVIIPFLGVIMSLGILVVVLAVLGILPEPLISIYHWILFNMNSFISWIASHEAFLLKNIPFSSALLIGSYLLIGSLYYVVTSKHPKRLYVLLLSIIILQAIVLFDKYHIQHSNQLIIFHQTKESTLGLKKGDQLKIISSNDSILKWNSVQHYIRENQTKKATTSTTFPNVLAYKKTHFLIIDSIGIYQNIPFKPDIVYLRQSPKINMERVVKTLNPRLVLADGSNYKSAIKLWEQTCHKNKFDFYYTGKNGAFIYD